MDYFESKNYIRTGMNIYEMPLLFIFDKIYYFYNMGEGRHKPEKRQSKINTHAWGNPLNLENSYSWGLITFK